MANPIEEITQRWERDVKDIKTAVDRMIEAMNKDTFTLDNPQVYETHDMESFQAIHPFWSSQKVFTFDGYIEGYHAYRGHYTEYFIQITENIVNYVDDMHADCHINYEAHNAPPGLIRPGVCVMTFHKKDGRWLCTSLATLNGIEPDDRCSKGAFCL
ncbi:hypothetical protein CERZMDRAFT_107994 [Cercospora zeae-maydis SCOH1-5]|uniref:SnoaL-like domain-containing protein n=1 Tax=Cercospora zeae-maydis SCOH1-5 TaxID=717836 RepID=A0A6A6EZ52_9PEZI|nr:hypothetical protein CERZMDRAFT_107994 [Cercospora zeae-maydis SCOH1-5]